MSNKMQYKIIQTACVIRSTYFRTQQRVKLSSEERADMA